MTTMNGVPPGSKHLEIFEASIGENGNIRDTKGIDTERPFSLGDIAEVPKRETPVGEKIKQSFQKFADYMKNSALGTFFTWVGEKIDKTVTDYKEAKLDRKAKALAGHADGKTLSGLVVTDKPTTVQALLDKIAPQGAAGGRLFGQLLLGDELKKRADLGRTGPLDPNHAGDAKIIRDKMVYLISASLNQPGNGQAMPLATARQNMRELAEFVSQGEGTSHPQAVSETRNLVMMALNLLSDPDELKAFAISSLKDGGFESLGKAGTFMRSETAVGRILVRVGTEGISEGRPEIIRDIFDLAGDVIEDIRTTSGDPIYEVGTTPQQRAELQVGLAEKTLDAVFGKDGEKMKARLGEGGVSQLREVGFELLRHAKKGGATDEVANGVVKQFYQNALFLRSNMGILPDIWARDEKQKGHPNYNPELANFMMTASKDIQLIANNGVDQAIRINKVSPELGEALKNSKISEKIDKIYENIGMPKLPNDALEVDTDEDFALNIGVALNLKPEGDLKPIPQDIFDNIASDMDDWENGNIGRLSGFGGIENEPMLNFFDDIEEPTPELILGGGPLLSTLDDLLKSLDEFDNGPVEDKGSNPRSFIHEIDKDNVVEGNTLSPAAQIRENEEEIAAIRIRADNERRPLSIEETRLIERFEQANEQLRLDI